MGDQARNNPRLIGGVYQMGQVIISGPVLKVYAAYNRNTGDGVGLLVLELSPTVDGQRVERWMRSLERRRAVSSPHVLRVYDWGIDSARAYITTDPPRGITLRHVLDNEHIDMQRALEIARQLARGLSALQGGGIVGLDLRPQLITVHAEEMTDRVQIDDVGIRSLLRELGYVDSQRSDDIGFLDPGYAAPESLEGDTIGAASDVYQVGLLLFELVTGRLPFVGRNAMETGVLQCTSPVPRMEQFQPDVHLSLQRVVDRALAKHPTQRFPHANALLMALEAVQLTRRRGPGEGDGGERPVKPGDAVLPKMGSGVTHGMLAIEDEMTVRMMPESVSAKQADDELEPANLATGQVYAYLCAEVNGVETPRFAMTEKEVVVGRADPKRSYMPDIDLTKLDPDMTVSRRHAKLRYVEPVFSVEDLRSRNKTKLGELQLTPTKPELVQHGDVLQFGAVRLVFKVPGK